MTNSSEPEDKELEVILEDFLNILTKHGFKTMVVLASNGEDELKCLRGKRTYIHELLESNIFSLRLSSMVVHSKQESEKESDSIANV